MRRVVLHVDRLVLRGIDRADAADFAEGLQAELQSLLSGPSDLAPLVVHGGSFSVQAGRAHVPQGGDAASVGRAVAGRIVRPARQA